MGNKFLSHIREVDAICFVLRAFTDENIVKEGSTDPKSDLEILKTELELSDHEMVEKHKKKKNQDMDSLPLLSKKPFLVAVNVDENDLKNASSLEKKYASELGVEEDQVVIVSAQIESDIAGLSPEDQSEYLKDLSVQESGLERLIKKAFSTLGLITFLTAGEKEVRAWTIKKDTRAQDAAGVIHTDFSKKFIKADVCDFETFIELDGWKHARDKGKVRSEGRDYIIKDGDVIEFKIGS